METISFARGQPPPEAFATEELADCADVVLKRDGKTILSYGAAGGYTPLREYLASWFDVHPYRVVLTNGGLQALSLLAQLRANGQNVFVEYPTYDRALKILLSAGASITPIVVDQEGMSYDDLAVQLQQTPTPTFVYTIPTFQNPTGETMSLERRRRIVELTELNHVLLYEDDPYSLVRFEGESLPALFDLTHRTSIYSSSFSKTISPGLRVAWTILPDDHLAARMTELAASTYITPVLLGQAIAHEFLVRGAFEQHLRRTKRLLQHRRDTMLEALERHLSGLRWSRPQGGFFIWLELPAGTKAQEVLDRAEGVAAVAGPEFGGPPNTMRLAFSFAAPDEIDAGIERLAKAIE